MLHNYLMFINKNRLKRGERSDTYLAYVCRMLWNVESLKEIEKKNSFQLVLWLSSTVEKESSYTSW